jgi:hypothetical protein
MKHTSLFILSLCILVGVMTLPGHGASNIGYKEFKLGQTFDEVKGILNSQYSGNKVKYLSSGDIELDITSDGMVTAALYFNHVKVLYKIHVALKYAEISKVKSRLVESYGQPNDFLNEEYYDADKRFLVARWFFDKQYRIILWESYYCRNQVMLPCVVEVQYLDQKGKEAKELYERKQKEEEQLKKDKKTYDGF